MACKHPDRRAANGSSRAFRVEICEEADKEHYTSKRQYAHVFHRSGVICVTKLFWLLPHTHVLGILLHEAGHLIAGPSKGEAAANKAVEGESGIAIRYKDSKHGERLEWIAPGDKAAAERFLGLR